MSAKIAGGDGKGGPKNAGPPLPREWTDALKDSKATTIQVPDGFLAVVWPDAPGDAAVVPAPPGFVNQVLEPTGGRIFSPEGLVLRRGPSRAGLHVDDLPGR